MKNKKQFYLQYQPKKIKYLGINLTEAVKDLNTKNYETLLMKTKGNLNKS